MKSFIAFFQEIKYWYWSRPADKLGWFMAKHIPRMFKIRIISLLANDAYAAGYGDYPGLQTYLDMYDTLFGKTNKEKLENGK